MAQYPIVFTEKVVSGYLRYPLTPIHWLSRACRRWCLQQLHDGRDAQRSNVGADQFPEAIGLVFLQGGR